MVVTSGRLPRQFAIPARAFVVGPRELCMLKHSSGLRWLACIFLCVLAVDRVTADDAENIVSTNATAVVRTQRVQDLADNLRVRLSLPDAVRVSLVPQNSLVVSVTRLKDASQSFVLSVEDGFLDGLSDDELAAVVAHELGHVWIFTHHPYLQTEELANQIALRVVTRISLNNVYQKVWARTGAKGTLAYLPGE
jgi:peptidase M48-like protein